MEDFQKLGYLTQKLYSGELLLPSDEKNLLLWFAVQGEEAAETPYSAIAKALAVSKRTVLDAAQRLSDRGYLEKMELGKSGRGRQCHGLVITWHSDFSHVQKAQQPNASESHKKAPSREVLPSQQNSLPRSVIVECAREIEALFRGNGGFVPYQLLNEEVSRFLGSRGMSEWKAFTRWLLVRSRQWKKLTVSDFSQIVFHYWDNEKHAHLEAQPTSH